MSAPSSASAVPLLSAWAAAVASRAGTALVGGAATLQEVSASGLGAPMSGHFIWVCWDHLQFLTLSVSLIVSPLTLFFWVKLPQYLPHCFCSTFPVLCHFFPPSQSLMFLFMSLLVPLLLAWLPFCIGHF